ncbi:MAG: peptidase [Thermodesulfobacteriota bacterium]
MTFCVGMRVRKGLVGIADTLVTSGSESITARKVTIHQYGRHSLFLMTSGLRSVRDKALTYFNEIMEQDDSTFDKLYKAVNAFAAQVRRVADEDKKALEEAGLHFDLFSIIGGQLENDREHKLYMLYPQGNWVEVGQGTPYYLIGESSYGKPIMDRALSYELNMETALKIGYLAFDATRTSATDVDFPIDVVLYRADSYEIVERRYERAELIQISDWWQKRLREAIRELPHDWVMAAFSKLGDGTK